ncbi:MAG: hypothetical protein AUK30_03455 [Nitrospirae bacterium CG2_30_70_394]|nr:SDR family NAD(P)-dependent oxidoreductase [Deltaproteobacteria bacterium]NCP96397.1 SDR family NAD(P)-dependent oxidoreductase [Deltaproteobacteria bacterium]OIP65972.1 MAG: hypothetical protein AUK30_03455 [Nitrospirae bacterium CG2_30_70_394]
MGRSGGPPRAPVALITGASSGIGAALARELCGRGYRLTLVARRGARLAALAAELGGEQVAVALVCDVRDGAAVERVAAAALARWGRLDLLVLNAGVGGGTAFPEFAMATAARVIETNLLGALAWLAPCLGPLVAARGTVVAISSLAGRFGSPRSPAYSASKAALSTFFEGMRVACRALPITVLTVEPGWVVTEMTAAMGRLPCAVSAATAARRIAQAVARHRTHLVFPRPAGWLIALVGRLPAPWRERLLRLRDPR